MATVGHAYLKIMPSLQGLGRHLRDQVREAETGTPAISLTAQVQTALLREQLRAAAREGDQTAIRLLAELDALPARTRFQALLRHLSGRSVSVRVVADRSLAATVRTLRALSTGVAANTVGFTRMSASVGASVLKYGALAAALGQVLGLLGGLGGAAATASGALLLIPAAGLAAAAAIGTLKLGVAGFSDALAEDDPAKYAEAIARFPPAMAAAANAVRALRPELTDLRREVQAQLFAGLAGEITALSGTYLPVLRAGLADMAGSLNAGALGFAAFAREGRTVADLTSILDNSSEAMGELAAATQPLLRGLRDIAAVGSEFLPALGSGLTDGAVKFADFIAAARESGQLGEWLSAGLSALGDLVALLGNLAQIVGTVFSAANTAGAGLLSTLVAVTGQMVAFLRSTEGAAVLEQIFGGLGEIIAGLGPLLGAFGDVLVSSIAPAIAVLGPMLGAAFAALAPAIAPLGQVLSALTPVLGVVATALASLLVPAAAVLAPIVAALAPAIGQIAALLGGALGQAIAVLSPALIQLAGVLAPLISQFGGLLVQAIRTAAPALGQLLSALAPIVAALGGALLAALSAVLPVLLRLAQVFTSVLLAALRAVMPVLPVVVGVIEQLAAIIATALAAAMPVLTEVATLLGQILAHAITALAPLIGPLAEAFGSVVAALVPLLPPILRLVAALLPPLLGLITSLLPIITQAAGLFATLVTAITPLITQIVRFLIPILRALLGVVESVFGIITAVIRGAMRVIQGVIDTVMGLISGDWDRAWTGIKNIVGGVWDAISGAVGARINGLLTWFVELPARILGALGDLGSLLREAGKNIIRGLIEGLTAGFRWVRDTLSDLTGSIASWKGPPARDRVLLTGNGRLIMGGLLAGLEDGEPQIRDYLTGLTDTLPLTVDAAVSPRTPTAPGTSRAPVVSPFGVATSALDAASITAAVAAGVLAALDGARLRVDGSGTARLVNTVNAANARR